MARDAVIYVGNLPGDVREREVEDLFYRHGRIRSIDIKPGFRSGMPAYCFVEFDDARDASSAVRKMDGHEAFGKRLRVDISRKAQGGGGGGRDGGSRGRSGGYGGGGGGYGLRGGSADNARRQVQGMSRGGGPNAGVGSERAVLGQLVSLLTKRDLLPVAFFTTPL